MGFAIGQKTPLGSFLLHLQQLDPQARLYSYLDDTYVVVDAAYSLLAVAGFKEAVEQLGMELNESKTAVWCPAGRTGVPAELRPYYKEALPVLGSVLKAQGDSDDAPYLLGQTGGGLEEATRRLGKLWATLQRLHAAGLKKQQVGALLRTYAGAASQHALQLALASDTETNNYDEQLAAAWTSLTERRLDETTKLRLGLPTRLGGAGLQWAHTRRYAAFWCGWTTLAADVKANAGVETLADLLDQLPQLTTQLNAARAGLAQQGTPPAEGAALADAMGTHVRQKALLTVAQKKLHAAHKQLLTTAGKACWESTGGPGAGAFLLYPTDANCSMEDAHWQTALRLRLGMRRPEYNQHQLAHATTTCQNKSTNGNTCGKPLDDDGFESLTCQTGGGVLLRHDCLARTCGGLVKRWTYQSPLFEQRVPQWDRERRRHSASEDPLERAVLDVEYTEQNERRWIDVSIRHAAAGDAADVARAARRKGEAARRGERCKHDRYPGNTLTAFVVEAHGRLGGEARQWIRRMVSALPDDEQSREQTRAYQAVSCTLQTYLARQLRKAAGLR